MAQWTALSSLLLAQTIYKHGDASFPTIAASLIKHPLLQVVSHPELSGWNVTADECEARYEELLSEHGLQREACAPVGPTFKPSASLQKLASILHGHHVQALKAEIRDEEQKFKILVQELEDIKAGKWDEKFAAQLGQAGDGDVEMGESVPTATTAEAVKNGAEEEEDASMQEMTETQVNAALDAIAPSPAAASVVPPAEDEMEGVEQAQTVQPVEQVVRSPTDAVPVVEENVTTEGVAVAALEKVTDEQINEVLAKQADERAAALEAETEKAVTPIAEALTPEAPAAEATEDDPAKFAELAQDEVAIGTKPEQTPVQVEKEPDFVQPADEIKASDKEPQLPEIAKDQGVRTDQEVIDVAEEVRDVTEPAAAPLEPSRTASAVDLVHTPAGPVVDVEQEEDAEIKTEAESATVTRGRKRSRTLESSNKGDIEPTPKRNSRRKTGASIDESSPAPAGGVPGTPATGKKFQQMITAVWNDISAQKSASVFTTNPTESSAPGYTSAVYHPTSLKTIKARIRDGSIQTAEEFHVEVMRMCANAVMFNRDGSAVGSMGREMCEGSDVLIQGFRAIQSGEGRRR
ncbi:hypothetical protein SAICODRAFT_35460 [Saitoella complicata NRRL Y-17804]|uniref:uncharacterized protein n=1 Tax=Saitoella complicata (strain BCRC 22490 / CBS 7301 / JCM 7358 / NBRC 10748 / NRRL Y-17804) TaxID=698492 RepID=UPI00086737E9|nr:uncharacterized protein SAICODRAFT_35460 [Saitoella complicata NRRL Y-17804]ODQ52808.1 hypothetical protein SAICODRAFT_35460 [Saitoella complicata NRRL Y-17804]